MLGAFALAAACSSSNSKAASPARTAGPPKATGLDTEATLPPGFPADIPLYPGARLTAAASFTSPGQVAWGMEWQTLDSVDRVEAFYRTKFSQGDWQIKFNGSANQAFSATYSRKSNPNARGLVAADGSSGITRITLSLSAPT
jgi:hypothetical protein